MEKIFIATGNAHKIEEFKDIFKILDINVDIITPKDFNDNSEPVEDGNSYEENSLIKAKFYYDKYKLPTIADDSGIEIDFYNGKPGIYSARFLNHLNYKERNEYIINEMKGSTNRGAKFTCCVTFINNDLVKVYKGIVNGSIANEVRGSEGFGYDPIFITNGQTKTNGELGVEFKNNNSHRAIALRMWSNEFKAK